MDREQSGIGLLTHDLQYRRKKIRQALKNHKKGGGYNLAVFEEKDTVVAYFSVAHELLKLYQRALFELEFVKENTGTGILPKKLVPKQSPKS